MKLSESPAGEMPARGTWEGAIFRFAGFALDPARRILRRDDEEIGLRPKSFDVLCCLAARRGALASRDDLIEAVWPDVTVTEESLSRCISDIRLALGDREQRIIKTIPRRGYVLAVPVAADAPEGREPSRPEAASTSSGDNRARVAVLAFDNLSAETEEQYFGDGIADDIITELSRFRDLVVIDRNSSFSYRGRTAEPERVGQELGVRFMLKGSVRRSGPRIRLNAQLIDIAGGGNRWAERYDCGLDDVFAVQDEVARAIVSHVAAFITKSELDDVPLRPQSFTAHDSYLRGAHHLRRYFAAYQGVEHLYEARRHFEHALAVDPGHARSHAALAESHIPTYQFKQDGDFFNPTIMERMRVHALKAIELDPNLPDGHGIFGHILVLNREHDAAIAAHERALALNANRVNWRFAIALVLAGEHERAIEVTHASMRLDPFYSPVAPGWLGIAYFMLRRYEDALPPLLESTSRASGWRGALLFLAATYARLGATDKASTAVAEMLQMAPGWRISETGQRLNLYRRPADSENLFAALRLAGMPE